MIAYKTSINELIKDLYKDQTIAYLNRYKAGQLFYRFTLKDDTYEFAIDLLDDGPGDPFNIPTYYLSEDIGITALEAQIPARSLARYIQKKATISELYIIKACV